MTEVERPTRVTQTITGQTGDLRCGGRVVASLTSWRIETYQDEDAPAESLTWRLTGAYRVDNPYLWDHLGDAELRIQVGRSTRRWRSVVLQSITPLVITGEGEPEAM